MMNRRLEAGVIEAILERLAEQTLPRALDIKRKVDAGEKLLDSDTLFLD
jgi:hypothetical protein